MDQSRSASGCPYADGPVPVHGAILAQDPHDLYDALRVRWGAIAPVEIAPGVDAWLVLGYQEVLELVWNDRAFSSDARRWTALTDGLLPEDSPLLATLGWRPALNRLDDTAHRHQRQAVTETLDRVDLRRLSAVVREQAEALVDEWAMHGSADLVTQYGRPLVWSVLKQLLGLEDSQGPKLVELTRSIVGSADEAAYAEAELMKLLRHLVAVKGNAPGPDLASWLLAHSAHLTDAEVAHNLAVFLCIGGQSTINWISSIMRMLLSDAGVSAALATGRMSVSDAADRAMWAGSPMTNISGRWARNDVTFAGCRIRAGDLLIPCLAAANTDPGIQEAGTLGNRAHLAWGTGAHACPAKEAARLIAEAAVDVLLRRLIDIRPGVPDAALHWQPSLWGAAPMGLPAVFTPTSREQRGATGQALAVMDVPDRRREDGATAGDPGPPRWGWWNSMGGW